MDRLRARPWLAFAGVLAAAIASIATSVVEPQCPRVTTRPGESEILPGSVTTKRYHVTASEKVGLTVVLHATAEMASNVRASLVPAEPLLFMSSSDGGVSVTRDLAVATGSEVTAMLALPTCLNNQRCDDYHVTLTLEHIAGAPAQVSWKVVALTEGCGDVHTVIEEL